MKYKKTTLKVIITIAVCSLLGTGISWAFMNDDEAGFLVVKRPQAPPKSTQKQSAFARPDFSNWHKNYLRRVRRCKKQEIPIELHTEDGITRRGILALTPKEPKGVIILCHPAAKDKNFMIPYDDLVFDEYHTLRFDFRRHGRDGRKQYTTMGKDEIYEVYAAVDFIKQDEKTRNLPLYGFGISLGAATLIEAEAKRHMFDALILQSSFESLSKQIKRMSGFYAMFPFLMYRQPTTYIIKKTYRWKMQKVTPMDSIKNVTIPVCLIHAKNDAFIKFRAFKKLRRSAPNVTHSWTPPQGKHTEILAMYPEEYPKQCMLFLEKIAILPVANLSASKEPIINASATNVDPSCAAAQQMIQEKL